MMRTIMATVVALLLPGQLLAGLPPSPSDCLQAPAAPELKAPPPDPWYTPRGVPYVKGLGADPTVRSLVTEAKKVKASPQSSCGPRRTARGR